MDRCSTTVQDVSIVADINEYISTVGVSYSTCLPYQQFLNAHLSEPTCPTSCQDGSELEQALKGEAFEIATREEVQDHLLTNGPVVLALKCTLFSK